MRLSHGFSTRVGVEDEEGDVAAAAGVLTARELFAGAKAPLASTEGLVEAARPEDAWCFPAVLMACIGWPLSAIRGGCVASDAGG